MLLCGLWGAAVWAFFGAAICRIAAVQLAADEQVGWGPALRFAAAKMAVLFRRAAAAASAASLLAAIPVLVLGLHHAGQRRAVVGRTVVALGVGGRLVMTLLLLGLLFGWPLMWATISAEGTDSFDALSRSYAYTFQRPLHYLFYVVVAGRRSAGSAGCWCGISPPASSGWAIGPPAGEAADDQIDAIMGSRRTA